MVGEVHVQAIAADAGVVDFFTADMELIEPPTPDRSIRFGSLGNALHGGRNAEPCERDPPVCCVGVHCASPS